MHWLSKVCIRHDPRCTSYLLTGDVTQQQPAWGRSREFDITTRAVSRHGMTQKTSGDLEEDEGEEEGGEFSLGGGHKKRKGQFIRTSGLLSPC